MISMIGIQTQTIGLKAQIGVKRHELIEDMGVVC